MIHVSPELIAMLKDGQMKIGTAHNRLQKEVLKRLTTADKMYGVIAELYPFKDKPEANEDIKAKLTQLHEKLINLQKKYCTKSIKLDNGNEQMHASAE